MIEHKGEDGHGRERQPVLIEIDSEKQTRFRALRADISILSKLGICVAVVGEWERQMLGRWRLRTMTGGQIAGNMGTVG